MEPEIRSGIAERTAAVSIAAIALVALAVQCFATYQVTSSVLLTLWIVFAYFTITTNLLVAIVFTAIAFNRSSLRRSWIVAGTMLSILLVGVIYGLLLHGLVELSGGSNLANILLHMVTPVLVPLFWILFVRKGELNWRHPLLWAIYPLAYLAYALVRGAATGKYAYPFVDVAALGWERTMVNALMIAVAFLLSGFAIVGLDRLLAARAQTT